MTAFEILHCLYVISLSADEDTRILLERIIYELEQRFKED